MLSVETVLKAADAAMNKELDPLDLDGLSAITRINIIAALAKVAMQETPPVAAMAVSAEDFALLSGEWEKARKTKHPNPALPKPTLVSSKP